MLIRVVVDCLVADMVMLRQTEGSVASNELGWQLDVLLTSFASKLRT